MDQVSPSPLTIRAGFDRAADERLTPDLIADLRRDPRTRVIAVHGDLIRTDADGRPATTPADPDDDAPTGFLGRDATSALLVILAAEAETHMGTWAPLRELAGVVDRDTAEILVTATALARWYVEAPFCPRCGSTTDLTTAGWARRCTGCGREHFPRTDPAVIVAVTDGDRLLLGSNAMWPQGRFSCFAGFVEAGESLESAVRREVGEEAGVTLGAVRYHGSQGWPYPRSLMLGFHADVVADTAEADGEEILEVRWFTRDEIRAALAGETEVTLPGRASIAYDLITTWVGAGA